MHGTIPPEAGRFVIDHIVSVAQLELLLLLRSDPDTTWTVAALVRELRADQRWIEEQLSYFGVLGLVSHMAGDMLSYCYSPRSPQLARVVDLVSRAYILNRVTVIELIYSRSTERIKAFADAFRLRKDSNDG